MKILACLMVVLAVACGGNSGVNTDGNGGGDGGPRPDGGPPPGCNGPDLTKPQCSNCIDDDGDGFIDSFDIQCTGPLDRDEATFSTGIPGDNMDAVNQDCFFDGDSGAGNDGCNIHVCCILGAPDQASCPIGANQYNPNNCTVTPECQMKCGGVTPPGCDCFGCCTLCNPNNPSECYDIATNPNTSPNCTTDVLSDPTKCLRCTKNTSCGDSDCGGDTCILCPGQDPDDLPSTCNGMTACPSGSQSCANGTACPSGTYCDAGSLCCVGIIL